MATKPEDIIEEEVEEVEDQEVLDLDEGDIIDDEDEETPPADDDDAPRFADEEDQQPAPENDLVKHLRQQIRDRDKRLAETQRVAAPEPDIVVGDKPTLESCGWDAEEYETQRDAWDDRKAAADKQALKREEAKRAQEDAWGKVTQDYATKKAALRYPDRDAAEQTALETLSPTAQALIAKHADNSALFIYAVGKSPTKLAELARIDAEGDPFAVVKAVTKMEANLTTKKTGARPPNPDVPVRGRPIAAVSGDKVLEKLEKEAERTGDRSKIIAHKRAIKEKAK